MASGDRLPRRTSSRSRIACVRGWSPNQPTLMETCVASWCERIVATTRSLSLVVASIRETLPSRDPRIFPKLRSFIESLSAARTVDRVAAKLSQPRAPEYERAEEFAATFTAGGTVAQPIRPIARQEPAVHLASRNSRPPSFGPCRPRRAGPSADPPADPIPAPRFGQGRPAEGHGAVALSARDLKLLGASLVRQTSSGGSKSRWPCPARQPRRR